MSSVLGFLLLAPSTGVTEKNLELRTPSLRYLSINLITAIGVGPADSYRFLTDCGRVAGVNRPVVIVCKLVKFCVRDANCVRSPSAEKRQHELFMSTIPTTGYNNVQTLFFYILCMGSVCSHFSVKQV